MRADRDERDPFDAGSGVDMVTPTVVRRNPHAVLRPIRPPGLVLALVCGAQFMIILDLAIVNVALSSIQADLGASQADLQWVVVGYGLTLGGFLLLGGRLADVLGRRPVLIAGLADLRRRLAGRRPGGSLGVLVACRVVQGLGGALVSPAALSILTTTFAEGPPATGPSASSALSAAPRPPSARSPAAP